MFVFQVLSYHASAQQAEVDKIMVTANMHIANEQLHAWHRWPFLISEMATWMSMKRMKKHSQVEYSEKILSPPNGSRTQVAISLIINSFLTLLSTYLSLQNGRPVSHMNLRVPHSSVVRVSNRHLEGHGFDSHWEDSAFFSEYST